MAPERTDEKKPEAPRTVEVAPALIVLAANGETPIWCMRARNLYWIDVERRQLHRFSPETGADEQWTMPEQIGAIALCRSGRVLVAMRSALILFNPADDERRRIASAPFDPELYRFNDGRCDALGRFWMGTKSEPRNGTPGVQQKLEPQHLWCFDRDGTFHSAPPRAAIGNGIAWSPDYRTLYFTDTSKRSISKYAFDFETGSLGRKRRFASFRRKEGEPDGSAVDSDGNYWVALYGGSKIACLGADGDRIREIKLPVRLPTMCTFGGDDLRTMFITTASAGVDEKGLGNDPLAGSLLQCRPGVQGLPPDLFDDELLLRMNS